MQAPLPPNEKERIESLRSYQILDTEGEDAYDDFTMLASHICDAPISLISLVDTHRQWFKSKKGIGGPELPRDIAFCAHTILSDQIMEIQDAHDDARFRDNPLVTGDPGIRFYAGTPLVSPEGFRLGSLCVIDRVPRNLDAEQREALFRLGRQVVHLMELRRQRSELDAAYRQLRELEGMRDSLQQMIVHDLRSLLGGVMGNLQLAEMTEDELASANHIAQALRCAEELLSMINGLLDVARLEAGEMPVTREAVHINELLQRVAGNLESTLEERELRYQLDANGALITCDRKLIARVVQNLLANAIKFTDQQHGQIVLETVLGEETVTFRVADNGPGIAAEYHQSVFDKFFQVTNKVYTGPSSGLGLAFCKLAVEAHGGTIGLNSSLGEGSVFYVTLPKAAVGTS